MLTYVTYVDICLFSYIFIKKIIIIIIIIISISIICFKIMKFVNKY